MEKFEDVQIVNGGRIPNSLNWNIAIQKMAKELKDGERLKIVIEPWSEEKEITDRQRKWYKGVCLQQLSENGESREDWDVRLKITCGKGLVKNKVVTLPNGTHTLILGSITSLSRAKMAKYIDNIIIKASEEGWYVTAPDATLRK